MHKKILISLFYPIKIVREGEMIVLTSDFPINFEESVEYSIIARKFEEIGEKIYTTTTSYELKNFGILYVCKECFIEPLFCERTLYGSLRPSEVTFHR